VGDLNRSEIEQAVQSSNIATLLIQVGLGITILFLVAGLASYMAVVNKKEAMIQQQKQQVLAMQQQQVQQAARFKQKLSALKHDYMEKLAREQQEKKKLAAEAATHIQDINKMIRRQMQQVEQAAANKQKEIEALSNSPG